ncbi:hypothetical protein JTB14_017726 [Gonioctena quinquepunctata]|nr:hypothetical protein JTB14_017726 [Gonioctena quinquepunctata]
MIVNYIVFVLALSSSYCYPQSVTLPDLTNYSPAEDINNLAHHHQQRSIVNNPPPSNNLEDTVKEVEAMLKANPSLPRLTRGEILDLLENITKTDQQQNSVYPVKATLQARDPKAFMVVMPYTPENTNGKDMEDLYTKPPVTHIIGESFLKHGDGLSTETKPSIETNSVGEGDKHTKPTSDKGKKFRGNPYRRTTPSPIPASSEIYEKLTPPVEQVKHYRRKKPQMTVDQEKPTTASPAVTAYFPTKRRPLRRRPTTTMISVDKHPNHRYPDEFPSDPTLSSTLPGDGLRIINPPKLSAQIINDDLLVAEDQNEEVFAKKDVPFSIERVTIKDIDLDGNSKSGTLAPWMGVDVPEDLKGVVSDMNLESVVQKQQPTTPQPLSADEEDTRIKNMLASLGVLPSQISTTTTQLPDISNVADNLSPDMQDLLMSFGLIPNTQKKLVSASQVSESFNPEKAEVKPESYVGFKPLPEDNGTRDEMEELLARFGLGRKSRKEKALSKGDTEEEEPTKHGVQQKQIWEKQELNLDMVPEEYLGVLEDIGLSDRKGKMIRTASLIKTQEKQHVFNPTDNQYATQEELDKLNNLMAIIKQLESLNRTVTEEDLTAIDKQNLKDLVHSLGASKEMVSLDEQNAPDPLKYDYGLSKNEVKRQENTTTTESGTTEEATPSIKDLEDSFGGLSDTVTETTAPETTTTRRRTGFYYLVDWNTFLDIDDQKGKRVNLRFQPTIGDPKRFYSVSVP